MIQTALLVLAAVVAAVLLVAAFRPDSYRVQRSVRIAAPPDAIHPWINNVERMNSWSPFVKLDPNIRGSYRGPAAGPGAAYDFDGNREVGQGSLEITASSPERIVMKLDMRKPMEGRNIIEFTLVPQGAQTDVTWAMQGRSPYLTRLIDLFVSMDRMIGSAFEAGLAELKAGVERAA